MGEVIVITSGKGGVGKSTLTAGLGLMLAGLNKRVALIDMDMGLRSLDIMLGLEHKVVFDLADVADGMCRVKQALVKHPQVEGLCLLSAAQMRGSEAVTAHQMERVMNQLRDRFDYILIDCPAGVGRGFKNAASCAERAILCTTPDAVAMRDAERVVGLLERQDVRAPALVLNRVLPRDMLDDCPVGPKAFEERLGLTLLGLIPEDEQLARREESLSLTRGTDSAFVRIARRLTGENVPLVPIKRAGLLSRLRQALSREPRPEKQTR